MRKGMNYDFLDSSISDEEFAKRFIAAYEAAMQNIDPDEYTVDPVQVKKLNDLIEFFKQSANELGGKIESIDVGIGISNGITANFIVFDLFGDEVERFSDVIRHCSAVTMDVTESNEISISCTIPSIFVHK